MNYGFMRGTRTYKGFFAHDTKLSEVFQVVNNVPSVQPISNPRGSREGNQKGYDDTDTAKKCKEGDRGKLCVVCFWVHIRLDIQSLFEKQQKESGDEKAMLELLADRKLCT